MPEEKVEQKKTERELRIEKLKEKFADTLVQVKDRSYLSTGYVTHKVTICGIPVVLRTMRKREKDFLNESAPIDLLTDPNWAGKFIQMDRPEESMKFIDGLLKRTTIVTKFNMILGIFCIASFNNQDLNIVKNFSSYDDFLKDEKVKAKIDFLDNSAATIFEKLLEEISELGGFFNFAIEENLNAPFPVQSGTRG